VAQSKSNVRKLGQKRRLNYGRGAFFSTWAKGREKAEKTQKKEKNGGSRCRQEKSHQTPNHPIKDTYPALQGRKSSPNQGPEQGGKAREKLRIYAKKGISGPAEGSPLTEQGP